MSRSVIVAGSRTAIGKLAGVFASLADAGRLDPELAGALAQAARQRNLLVHSYLEVDDRKILDSLEHLDEFREFSAAVQAVLDAEPA